MPFGGFAPLPLRLTNDATRGWSPEQHARACADIVAVTRVAPFATVYVENTGSIGSKTIRAMYGVGAAHLPTVTRTGTGVVVLTWDREYEDEFEQSEPVNILHAKATTNNTGTFATFDISNPWELTVYTWNRVSGAAADTSFAVQVWT